MDVDVRIVRLGDSKCIKNKVDSACKSGYRDLQAEYSNYKCPKCTLNLVNHIRGTFGAFALFSMQITTRSDTIREKRKTYLKCTLLHLLNYRKKILAFIGCATVFGARR